MKSVRIVFSIAVFALFEDLALGQERPADPKEIAKLSQPGPEHEKLHALVGKWTLTLEGAKGTGTAEFKKVLGGRFVMEEVKLPLGPVTMEWIGLYGYDKAKKKYTAVWVDNMDTSTESGEGDGDGPVLTLKGNHFDPRTGKPEPFAWRITRDGDKLKIEMLGNDRTGKEQVLMTVKGERAK
jgi:hypothetical protein